MPSRNKADELDVSRLGLGQLAFFVGQCLNERVLAELRERGHEKLRISHGYVIQHLVGADRTINELAERMGVSQQAASKAAAELSSLGYIADAETDDARTRRVGLSPKGRAMLDETRRLRDALERELVRGSTGRAVADARRVLAAMLEKLGGADAVRRRRVREPSHAATRVRGRKARVEG
ncbi:MAG TPA: MarR family transcriptional regulator [Polyangiaceae bacterium]|nr:MarR family transcriptional regulator [Polyangiaceae bacterium]